MSEKDLSDAISRLELYLLHVLTDIHKLKRRYEVAKDSGKRILELWINQGRRVLQHFERLLYEQRFSDNILPFPSPNEVYLIAMINEHSEE